MTFTPGYYQTNPRAQRYRELVRLWGRRRAIGRWLTRWFRRPTGGTWMPGLWADMECRAEDLSEQFRQAAKLHDANFKRLGFVECGFVKVTKNLNPILRDNGGIRYLDTTRRYFANLIYHRLRSPSTGADIPRVYIFFSAAFQSGSLTCTNHAQGVDKLPDREVIRVKSYDVNVIHQEFLKRVKLRREMPIEFPDHVSLRQWIDARAVAAFEANVRRGLYIPMTEQQIAAARAKKVEADAGIFPPLRRKLQLRFWPVLIILFVLLDLTRMRHGHGAISDDSVEYRGQPCKMSKAYDSYEDYKDDPDNLNTNELDRIEQAMISVKVPSTFKDREAVIHFLFYDMQFPGYGAGSQHVQADDGSEIEADSVEIPQRDKDRYFVVRNDQAQYSLVDDFILGTATNRIEKIKLEKQVLRYYDGSGHLVREKHLPQL